MNVHIIHDALVTVVDTFLRRCYGARRHGELWFSDSGRVSARVQHAIEAQFRRAFKARS